MFLERAAGLDRVPHMRIDVVPVDEEMSEEVRLFFTKSLLEDDAEWASHRKVIDTVAKGGIIKKVIPWNMEYLHVDFNGRGGFAHVIEDERRYGPHLHLEVLSSALGIEDVNFSIPLGKHEQEEEGRRMRKQFKPFDWSRHK